MREATAWTIEWRVITWKLFFRKLLATTIGWANIVAAFEQVFKAYHDLPDSTWYQVVDCLIVVIIVNLILITAAWKQYLTGIVWVGIAVTANISSLEWWPIVLLDRTSLVHIDPGPKTRGMIKTIVLFTTIIGLEALWKGIRGAAVTATELNARRVNTNPISPTDMEMNSPPPYSEQEDHGNRLPTYEEAMAITHSSHVPPPRDTS